MSSVSHADRCAYRAAEWLGQTGDRFPSILGRWRHKPEEQDPEQQAADATGAQRPPGQQQAAPQPEIAPPVPEPDCGDGADWDRSKETDDLVRPYFWMGGRTTSRVDLRSRPWSR
jgi:hypothetical protein